MALCNICGNSEFIDFNGRKNIQCSVCKSLERHRLLRWVLEDMNVSGTRALHLAPEEMTHRYLKQIFGGGYICSDLIPSKFPHAQCLALRLPEGFDIFPDSYFDLIVHNHVLEHIPGDYRDHLSSFLRLLHPTGHMVFTLPSISKISKTVQCGELLPSDAERVRLHGQSDHYKSFGYDLLTWFESASGKLEIANIPDDVRCSLQAPHDPVFIYSSINNANGKIL